MIKASKPFGCAIDLESAGKVAHLNHPREVPCLSSIAIPDLS